MNVRWFRASRWMVCGLGLIGIGTTIGGCGMPGALMGGGFPFGMDFGFRTDDRTIGQRYRAYSNLSDDLLMTADQRKAAEALDEKLADDIDALRETARADFLKTLTAEQQTLLDELGKEFPSIERLDFLTSTRSGGMFGRRHEGASFDTVVTRLGLTADQVTAAEAIHDQLPDDIRARREQADEEFKAILDASQIELLDDLLSRQSGFFPF